MGKAQSKRSVDITTEVVSNEGAGRVEKIEDVDQLKPVAQVNGDTQHTESENQKVVESEGAENEKDLATEKNKPQTDTAPSAEKKENAEKTIEGESVSTPSNAQEESLNESKVNETAEAAPAPDSSKKSKKDKLKKKWSFRSISFGKKDKQKPVKKPEEKAEVSKEEVATTAAAITTEVAATTNGECEKVPEEKSAEEQKTEETVAVPALSEVSDDAKNEVKVSLNGDYDEKTQEKKSEVVVEDKTINEIETVAVNGASSVKEEKQEPVVVSNVEKEEGFILNGNVTEAQSSKIEVKSNTDIITDPPTTTSAQTPPPLPLSPQPTQVMVFALSSSNDQQENESKPTTIDLNTTPQLQIPSVIETAPTPEIEKKEVFEECKESPATGSENIKNETSGAKNTEVDIDQLISSENLKSDTISVIKNSEVVVDQDIDSQNIVEDISSQVLSSGNETLESQIDEESSHQEASSEKEVLQSQVDETLLTSPQLLSSEIDESQNQIDEVISSSQVLSSENESLQGKIYESEDQNQISEEESAEKNIVEETLVQEKENIAENLVEEVTQKAVDIVEQQQLEREDDLPSPPPSPVDNNVGVSNGTTIHSINTSVDVVTESATTSDAEVQESTHKENGISHDTSTEESLNGKVEPTKTIEEMKAEHVGDQLPAVVTATE